MATWTILDEMSARIRREETWKCLPIADIEDRTSVNAAWIVLSSDESCSAVVDDTDRRALVEDLVRRINASDQ